MSDCRVWLFYGIVIPYFVYGFKLQTSNLLCCAVGVLKTLFYSLVYLVVSFKVAFVRLRFGVFALRFLEAYGYMVSPSSFMFSYIRLLLGL